MWKAEREDLFIVATKHVIADLCIKWRSLRNRKREAPNAHHYLCAFVSQTKDPVIHKVLGKTKMALEWMKAGFALQAGAQASLRPKNPSFHSKGKGGILWRASLFFLSDWFCLLEGVCTILSAVQMTALLVCWVPELTSLWLTVTGLLSRLPASPALLTMGKEGLPEGPGLISVGQPPTLHPEEWEGKAKSEHARFPSLFRQRHSSVVYFSLRALITASSQPLRGLISAPPTPTSPTAGTKSVLFTSLWSSQGAWGPEGTFPVRSWPYCSRRIATMPHTKWHVCPTDQMGKNYKRFISDGYCLWVEKYSSGKCSLSQGRGWRILPAAPSAWGSPWPSFTWELMGRRILPFQLLAKFSFGHFSSALKTSVNPSFATLSQAHGTHSRRLIGCVRCHAWVRRTHSVSTAEGGQVPRVPFPIESEGQEQTKQQK